ncbi:MAG: WG repeat-containing protein [Campylobacteraceae bacterium]|jgi:hypothetical protein|nr:WG repeat-containing protein [Campylobacteraceae bacterium]
MVRILILLGVLVLTLSANQTLSPFFVEGWGWGYIDEEGDFVIEPRFQKAYDFKCGSALVRMANEKLKFINQKGEFIADPPPCLADKNSSTSANPKKSLNEDNVIKTVTEVKEEKKSVRFICDFYDKAGNLLVGGADRYSEEDDMYIFNINQKYGMLSKKEAKVVLEPIYDNVKYFYPIRLAQVRLNGGDRQPYIYGMANSKGEFILEPKYKDDGSYSGKFKVGNATLHMNTVGVDIEGSYDKNADFIRKINEAVDDLTTRRHQEEGSYSDVARVREICGVAVVQNKKGDIVLPTKKYTGKVSDTPEAVVMGFFSDTKRGFEGVTLQTVMKAGINFKFPAMGFMYESLFYKDSNYEFRKRYADFLWQLSIQRQDNKPKIDNVKYCNDYTLSEVTVGYEDKGGDTSMAKSSFSLIKTKDGWKILMGR